MSSRKYRFFSVLILMLLLASWYTFEINIGNSTVATTPELLIYFIILNAITFKHVRIKLPTSVRKYVFLFLLYGVVSVLFSLINNNLIGPTVGGFRRLFYYPVLGLLAGSTFAQYKWSEIALKRALNLFVPVLVLIAVFSFIYAYQLKFPMFIYRYQAMILLLIILQKYENYIYSATRLNYINMLMLFLLIFSTFSRGIYITVIGALIYFASLLKKSLLIKRIGITILVLVCIVIIALNYIPAAKTEISVITLQIVNAMQGDFGTYGTQTNSIGLRFYRYQSAFRIGLEKPMFGHGMGFKPKGFEIFGNYNRVEREKTAHNYFLTIFMKFGFFGVIVFVVFIYKLQKELTQLSVKVFFIGCFAYSLVDVMMASTHAAILGVFFISGYFLSYSHPSNVETDSK